MTRCAARLPNSLMPDALRDFATIVGWDIGGAHLKAAWLDADACLRKVIQLPCPLWQGMDRLETACDGVLAELPARSVLHAVTMTGEMADLFPDRASGVVAIVTFLNDLLAQKRPGDAMRVFAGNRGFVRAENVRAGPGGNTDLIASANWLATALRCAGSQREGILVDIGSTTTDLIPFAGSRVVATGDGDRERLASGELVYVGVVRTPLMALAQKVPFAGAWRGTMNEHFATTADVFRILGELDEACDVQPPADGGAKTVEASTRRLLRMVAEDLPATGMESVRELARWYRTRLLDLIADGFDQCLARGSVAGDAPLIGAGIGRFLVADLAARVGRPYRPIGELLCRGDAPESVRQRAADCAPAVAVAQLMLESVT
jgi:probable H4MPT-linked C1 transfer pathway protein